MEYLPQKLTLTLLRVGLGFVFLWAFLDKLLGLGFSTKATNAWVNGGSPITGYLKSLQGDYSSYFTGLANNSLVDWLFMIALLILGVSLILGILVKIVSIGGIILMVLLWLSSFPIKTNPFIDEHFIYALILAYFVTVAPGMWYGLGKWWKELSFVNKNKILE